MTGSEFRAIRKRMRINQTKLAKIMGTFQSTVSRWESLQSVPPIPAAFMHVLDVGDTLFSVRETLHPGLMEYEERAFPKAPSHDVQRGE